MIRGIQNLRKDSGLNVTDRIKLSVSGDSELHDAFEMFADFICNETLAKDSCWVDNMSNGVNIESEDKSWSISIEKA